MRTRTLKKIAFTLILCVMLFVFLEAASVLVHRLVKHTPSPRSMFGPEMLSLAAGGGTTDSVAELAKAAERPSGNVPEALHPYLGFVRDPSRTPGISNYGFPGGDPPVFEAGGEHVVVGVFGGSFAESLYFAGSQRWVRALETRGQPVKVVNVAMGGYKQPQQLMALVYFLSLGARFDIVINVDGFNEIALPPVENIPKHVNPAYPRAWYFRMADVSSPAVLSQLAQVTAMDQKRRRWAAVFAGTPAARSNLGCLIWKARDRALRTRRNELLLSLRRQRDDTQAYAVTGPDRSYADDEAMYDDLALYWKRCSEQMHAVCKANGIRYLHFLQPNQYVGGSKPMTPEEKAIAIRADHPYGAAAAKGYGPLMRRGAELAHEGVEFHDLTGVFSGNRDVLYNDDCCHVNTAGYDIVATVIAGFLAAGPNAGAAGPNAGAAGPNAGAAGPNAGAAGPNAGAAGAPAAAPAGREPGAGGRP